MFLYALIFVIFCLFEINSLFFYIFQKKLALTGAEDETFIFFSSYRSTCCFCKFL